MRTIWKLNLGAESHVLNRDRHGPLPTGAEVLSAAVFRTSPEDDRPRRFDGPYLWVEVDTAHVQEERLFHLVHTGQEVPADADYVITAAADGYVVHIYETRRPTASALERAIRLREE